MHSSIKLALATFAVASVGVVGAPSANAATEHCTDQTGKVESNAGPDLYVGTQYAGSTFCIKTGTKAYNVVVDSNGYIHSTVWNKPGNGRLGISYYVPGPCEYPCGNPS